MLYLSLAQVYNSQHKMPAPLLPAPNKQNPIDITRARAHLFEPCASGDNWGGGGLCRTGGTRLAYAGILCSGNNLIQARETLL